MTRIINYAMRMMREKKNNMPVHAPVCLPVDNNDTNNIKNYLMQKLVEDPKSKKVAVFCTTCIAFQGERIKKWFNYYKNFFNHLDLDFYAYNDGPEYLEIEGLNYFPLSPWLGRPGHFVDPGSKINYYLQPGWKRSFSCALKKLKNNYDKIVHIEADLELYEYSKNLLTQAIFDDNYYCGWDMVHNNVETALQVFSNDVAEFFIKRYENGQNLYEECYFEDLVKKELKPYMFMKGQRLERGYDPSRPSDFLAQSNFSS